MTCQTWRRSQPAVAQACCPSYPRRRSPATNPYRWPIWLGRPWPQIDAMRRVEPSLECPFIAPPQRAHGLDRLVEAGPAFTEVETHGLMVPLLGTRPDRDDGAPTREPVDCPDGLGQLHRPTHDWQRHRCHQRHAVRVGNDRGQCCEAIQPWHRIHHVIVRSQSRESEAICCFRIFDQMVERVRVAAEVH